MREDFLDWLGYGQREGHNTRRDTRRDWVNPGGQNTTERDAPYGFSEYFLWRDNTVQPAEAGDSHAKCDKGISGAYSDRLQEWNYAGFNAAIDSCGGLGTHPPREVMNKFLTDYFGKSTIAHAMARGCNVGNGYPYWIVWFSHADERVSAEVVQ